MLKPLDSHKPATSSTFLPHDRPEVLRKLNEMEFSESDRLSDNYKDLDWFGFEAISIYERDDKIIGFSSVIHRPEYFAKKECRILNRYFESVEMRRTSKIIGDDHVCEMIMQQLDIAKKIGFENTINTSCPTMWKIKSESNKEEKNFFIKALLKVQSYRSFLYLPSW